MTAGRVVRKTMSQYSSQITVQANAKGGTVPEPKALSNDLSAPTIETEPTNGSAEPPRPGQSPEALDCLDLIKHHSHLLLAVVDVTISQASQPESHRILFANDYFCRLTGLTLDGQTTTASLLNRLSREEQTGIRDRFRRHCLNAILAHCYGEPQLVAGRLLHDPLLVSLVDSVTGQPRTLELRLRSADQGGMAITTLSPTLKARLQTCWQTPPTKQQVMTQLLTPGSPLQRFLANLTPDGYTASGCVLLEGMDVTERETSKALVQLLASRESVLEPSKFNQANDLMKTLFDADGSLLLSAEQSQAKLFTGLDKPAWDSFTYGVEELAGSVFFQATERNEVLNIPDLSLTGTTQSERDVLGTGVRSLLLIPLVMQPALLGKSPERLIGLVGITSSRPCAFDQVDCSNATTLVPALTAAMRHSVQDRFTNIHPSVRWRFEQEAERRSWGLSPAPIVFENVYPLYGISDIRGSSIERNRSIQQDLLAQFRLALQVVDAVSSQVQNALVRQLDLDLQEHIADLEKGITVDAELTQLRYLKEEVEAHFPCFSQLSPAAAEAVQQYQQAIHDEHGCVYSARAVYDQTINHINTLLRSTWNHWQQSMQAITQHYCDVEATDGIDHMIYAGQAIDAKFTDFHLRSLRYEQLRAVCDCARQSFALKAMYDTDMVVTHLVLVQAFTVDIMHDENTERLFDVRGTRDTRYEIVKKRIDKACHNDTGERITQPGMLTIVYSTDEEWQEYRKYLRYLHREGWVDTHIERGGVEPLQGVSGLKFARVRVLPATESPS
jgi:hypothetical protein